MENRIALVYPANLPAKRDELIPFYDAFIRLILQEGSIKTLFIIHRQSLKTLLQKKFSNQKVELIQINSVQDIWIRDWGPISVKDNKAIKALYLPKYFSEKDKQYALKDDNAGQKLIQHLNLKYEELRFKNQRIILDGGNLIDNMNGVAITTNRIIADNEYFSIEDIKATLKYQLKIKELKIVPVEPGDVTGHVDGMIRFVDRRTIVVGSYGKDYADGKVFLDNLAKELEDDFEVVRVLNESPKEEENELPSAFGNYVNFLKVGDNVFLPQYGIKKDKEAKRIFEKYFKVIPVTVDIAKLSDLGGVLNCITWTL